MIDQLLLQSGWIREDAVENIDKLVDPLEKRRMRIFNRLNFLGLLTGILLPIAGLLNNDELPAIAWVVACSPAFISGTVLWLSMLGHTTAALMVYFTSYPVLSSLVYAANLDLGIELFFILYGVLSVFFLPKLWQAFFCGAIAALCYILVYVLKRDYTIQLSSLNYPFFVGNHLLALFFIFYGLYLIKKENTGYQEELIQFNEKLQAQKLLVEEQSAQLSDLNNLKDKLFSVIAHDLRTPMYALKNLFRNIEKYDLPAEEVKLMIPDINKEMQFTTNLMENLLQWAKSQLQAAAAHPEELNLAMVTEEVLNQVHLQASGKSIEIRNRLPGEIGVWADRDMTQLVLRNLLSNALKFTPENGMVIIGSRELDAHVEVYVKDNGAGMSAETIEKLQENAFFTTQGTNKESGTGLGLMLCREYLHRNGGWLSIRSDLGQGSEFCFTLPKRRLA
ncbi:HAMP domain-containing histidine kinase [Flavihumibacter rivuli]|uniref:sensor histidine kinase n=1 Tax=Flavihumibacter rivuli TaxID=2838156 RepID=UPI001BDEB50F|nr:HAMP domain-containing sensor histidine kinase [Flavihumibacter rivuli]ULQ57793.1 HAMP domain-containing histidine kinase [Flavihumibacter rivuli]